MKTSKKWAIGVAVVASTVTALVLGAYAYGGGFQSLRVDTVEVSQQPMAGLDYTGPYETMFPTFEKANALLDSLGHPSAPGIGWYLDDPSTVDPKNCRGFYGRFLHDSPDSVRTAALRLAGLRTDTLPGGTALVVAYKATNTLAYMIGALRAYPLLTEAYQTSRRAAPLAVYEKYDEGTTYYTFVFANESTQP
jgi:hypothetical protein